MWLDRTILFLSYIKYEHLMVKSYLGNRTSPGICFIKLCKGLPKLSQYDSCGHLFFQILSLRAFACIGIFFLKQRLINFKMLRLLNRFVDLVMIHYWLKAIFCSQTHPNLHPIICNLIIKSYGGTF